jgi:3-phenylpropionate/trans-cinnamate dioxygenase ferredoxin reductase subunit
MRVMRLAFPNVDALVVRGTIPPTGKFSIMYLRKRQMIALDCVSMTRDYAQGAMVLQGTRADAEVLAEVTTPLK